MFTYKEALEENRRMIEFREKHLYNSKSHNSAAADHNNYSNLENTSTYNFYK